MAKIGRMKKRRIRSPHRGVKVLQRRRTHGVVYIGRWFDPIQKAWRETSLTQGGFSTEESRRAWAMRKASEISRIKERGAGAAMTVNQAVEHYFEVQQELRENTRYAYRYALDHFMSWAQREGLTLCYQLTPGHLARLHGYIKMLTKRAPQSNEDVGQEIRPPKGERGVGRGARKPTDVLLSAASRNQILRGCHTFLNFIRRRDLTPSITSDDIKDRLPYVRGEVATINFLRVKQITALLEAAQRHDDAKFFLTRAEHDGEREPGTTPKYQPIRPFIVACLLMGGRFGEVAGLRWDEVDLDAGEIRLDPKRVKTKIGRLIRLKSTPLLATMLNELRERSEHGTHVFCSRRWNDLQKLWEVAPGMLRDVAESARERLISKYGAPEFTWQDLRRTCATFLCNMPNANLKHAADYLGHSIEMAEARYWSQVEIHPSARTLEEAMGIVALQRTDVA